MTAEIAVLNRRGVALAADSAVTVDIGGGRKVYPSGNKLFMLSKYEPVGVMVYNSADLLGVPWETIIKLHRDSLGRQRHKSLRDYATNLLSWIGINAKDG